MNTCGHRCLGNTACAKSCIQGVEHYSDGCSQCFGDLIGCTAHSCWSHCIGGESPACKQCVIDHCDTPFTTCSGFTPPQASFSVTAAKSMRAEAADQILAQSRVYASCSGTAEPPAARPLCYSGSKSVLGVTETVNLKMKTYASGHGTMDVSGSGFKAFTCTDHAFSKSGQAISVDISDCADGLAVSQAAYCSDSDTITVTVRDSHLPIPVSVTLARSAGNCA